MPIKLKHAANGDYHIRAGIREVIVGMILLITPVMLSTVINWRLAKKDIARNTILSEKNAEAIVKIKILDGQIITKVDRMGEDIAEIKRDIKGRFHPGEQKEEIK